MFAARHRACAGGGGWGADLVFGTVGWQQQRIAGMQTDTSAFCTARVYSTQLLAEPKQAAVWSTWNAW